MTGDRPLLGILLMTGFAAIAPGMDAFAKLAGEAIPVGQILAFRFGIQTLVLVPLALGLGALVRQSGKAILLHAVRAALILAATGCFFSALRFMPMADAIAIFFVEPFILTLLGAVFLGETIGWRRLLACAIGFAGALLVIRPSFGDLGAIALLPLATAVFFALYMVLTRKVAKALHPVALQAWTALAAAVLILPLLAVFEGSGIQPLDAVMPQGAYWAFLVGVGATATLSHLLLSGALRFAPAATIAPLQYLEIVSATLLGLMLFGDFPDRQTLIGIAVIVTSGIYVFLRERDLGRRPAPPP
ncbi:MAG: DMT family transporter [Rhodobacter sp.]|nr:DMT family transporter [Rhodobacter sp.]